MLVFLETERLVLRQSTEADLEDLSALNGDPDVMRFVGGTITRGRIEREFLPAYLLYYQVSDRYGFWAAIEKATGDFLGWFHLRPLQGTGTHDPELGYRLRKIAWGHSYATEGSRALIHKAFAELNVKRVVASTLAVNVASRRVLEKACAGSASIRLARPRPAKAWRSSMPWISLIGEIPQGPGLDSLGPLHFPPPS